jgi:Outer membrane protein beta-barrel family/CarboxypepD_reg-like domain
MRYIFSVLIMLIFSSVIIAQKAVIKGVVYDTASKKGLAYATVSLVNEKDSTLINFTRADSTGKFILKQVNQGVYLLSTSYVGFMPVWKKIAVAGDEINIGNVNMVDVKLAGNVTVNAKRPPVVMNNDTLEFNTENFKTQPNAVVEDLLKKLPGVTIDADGTVRVNGEKVNRVFVNGKDFFNGDPKMATKNLDADAVDKVQVFDKKSDQSEFTGVDDGNSQKAINLKLKKDRNHALFGRATAGAGTNDRFEVQSNINKFNGDQQLSFIGMANNTNKQGFSIGDVLNFTGELSKGMRNGGGNIRITTSDGPATAGLPVTGLGQNQQGIAETYAGGVNYNDNWNKKTDVNASGTLSDIHLNTDRDTKRQYLLPGNNYTYSSSTNSVTDINQQRVNMAFDQKLDSFSSLKITPVLSWQQQNNYSSNTFSSIDLNNIKLNDGYNNNYTHSEGYNLGTTALYRQRFKKKGRTISGNFNGTYNHSMQNGSINAKTSFYSGGTAKDSILNQTNNLDAVTRNVGGNITYTEPVGKRSLVEFTGFINSNTGESNKQTYNYNSSTGKHDIANAALTNNFKSNYLYSGGSINFRSNQKKINYTVGASLQAAQLQSINQTTGNNINQSFTDVLPNSNLQYKFSNYKNIRFDYSTSTLQPSTTQLQPVDNVSDPLNITTGNPDLKRSYVNNFTINYFAADPATRKNFFALALFNVTQNAIVNADDITNGVRKSMPVNANGVLFGLINASYGFPIIKLKSRIDVSMGYNYTHSIAYLNGAMNAIDNSSITPTFTYSYGIDNVIDVQAIANVRFNNSAYSLQPQLNTQYVTQQYTADVTNYLPWKLVLNNKLNYVINTGRVDGYNTSIPIWNASIAKSFLKNSRAEFKLSAYDKNLGITRSSNQNYIEDSRYNVLQQYFLLSFTYILNKAGKTAGGPNVVIKTIGN